MTLTAQAAFVTEVQRACREARESRSRDALEKAAALMNSPQFDALPLGNQTDLYEAYARAHLMVTAGGAA